MISRDLAPTSIRSGRYASMACHSLSRWRGASRAARPTPTAPSRSSPPTTPTCRRAGSRGGARCGSPRKTGRDAPVPADRLRAQEGRGARAGPPRRRARRRARGAERLPAQAGQVAWSRAVREGKPALHPHARRRRAGSSCRSRRRGQPARRYAGTRSSFGRLPRVRCLSRRPAT